MSTEPTVEDDALTSPCSPDLRAWQLETTDSNANVFTAWPRPALDFGSHENPQHTTELQSTDTKQTVPGYPPGQELPSLGLGVHHGEVPPIGAPPETSFRRAFTLEEEVATDPNIPPSVLLDHSRQRRLSLQLTLQDLFSGFDQLLQYTQTLVSAVSAPPDPNVDSIIPPPDLLYLQHQCQSQLEVVLSRYTTARKTSYDLTTVDVRLQHALPETLPNDPGVTSLPPPNTGRLVASDALPDEDMSPLLRRYYDRRGDWNIFHERLIEHDTFYAEDTAHRNLLADQGKQPSVTDEVFDQNYQSRRDQLCTELAAAESDVRALKAACNDAGVSIPSRQKVPTSRLSESIEGSEAAESPDASAVDMDLYRGSPGASIEMFNQGLPQPVIEKWIQTVNDETPPTLGPEPSLGRSVNSSRTPSVIWDDDLQDPLQNSVTLQDLVDPRTSAEDALRMQGASDEPAIAYEEPPFAAPVPIKQSIGPLGHSDDYVGVDTVTDPAIANGPMLPQTLHPVTYQQPLFESSSYRSGVLPGSDMHENVNDNLVAQYTSQRVQMANRSTQTSPMPQLGQSSTGNARQRPMELANPPTKGSTKYAGEPEPANSVSQPSATDDTDSRGTEPSDAKSPPLATYRLPAASTPNNKPA